jgi:hypothetical protein
MLKISQPSGLPDHRQQVSISDFKFLADLRPGFTNKKD